MSTPLRRSALLLAGLLVPGLLAAAPIRVLLLTGANNHDWRATTPVLKSTLEEGGRFAVTVVTNVPQMRPGDFSGYDAVLSNFNTFGKKNPGPVWDSAMRTAFVDYVRSGHGFIVVHAGSAGFYDWPTFQTVAGATWGKATAHGRMHTNEIHLLPTGHAITAGLRDFTTFDEFWQNAQIAPGALALATVTPKPEFGGSGRPEPIALVTQLGQGRGFTLLLGHNARSMAAPGFQALLCRGAEWAATGQVSPDNHPLK